MINLRNYCVKVTTGRERKVAITFFKRATHLPVKHYNSFANYVGLANDYPGRCVAYGAKPRCVVCGNTPCPNETIIPFENLHQLADSPNRRKALVSARNSKA